MITIVFIPKKNDTLQILADNKQQSSNLIMLVESVENASNYT